METIKINEIVKKGVVCIVKYFCEGQGSCPTPLEATLNINFNKQEIWYLENEVGIGGTVSVEITNKEKQAGNPSAGFWVNITKVDMKSAVKGTVNKTDVTPCNANLMSQKDIMIISQCLTKVVGDVMKHREDGDGEKWSKTEQHVLAAYRFFVLELEQNG